MLLTPHLMAGAFVSSYFGGNIFISVIVTFLNYFFIESIPHWDPENPKKKLTHITRYLDYFFSSIIITFCIYILFLGGKLSFVSYGLNVTLNYFHISGVFITLLIYLIINLLTTLSNPPKYVVSFLKLYKRIKNNDRSYWGIFIQFAIVVVSFAIIFRYFHIPSIAELLR